VAPCEPTLQQPTQRRAIPGWSSVIIVGIGKFFIKHPLPLSIIQTHRARSAVATLLLVDGSNFPPAIAGGEPAFVCASWLV